MRSRTPLFALLFTVGFFTLPHLAHAAIPFFGPIIPGGNNVCPAGWGMLMTVINNIIELLLTIAIVFVTPLMLAYAGFLYVVNPFNPSDISKAKSILINTIVGIVIALAGWMIVDAIMVVLYNGPPGTWASLITSSGPACLPQAGALPQDPLNPTKTTPGVSAGGGTVSTGLSTAQGDPCNPATITAAVPSASPSQANLLACVAQGESTCGTTNPPYNLNYSWNKDAGKGKASTAAGAYQVLLSSNHSCYENSTCYTPAGVSGPLNCQNAFDSNGFVIAGSAALLPCEKAAGNVACSAAAAVCLLGKQSFLSAYKTDPYTAGCISTYGN